MAKKEERRIDYGQTALPVFKPEAETGNKYERGAAIGRNAGKLELMLNAARMGTQQDASRITSQTSLAATDIASNTSLAQTAMQHGPGGSADRALAHTTPLRDAQVDLHRATAGYKSAIAQPQADFLRAQAGSEAQMTATGAAELDILNRLKEAKIQEGILGAGLSTAINEQKLAEITGAGGLNPTWETRANESLQDLLDSYYNKDQGSKFGKFAKSLALPLPSMVSAASQRYDRYKQDQLAKRYRRHFE